MLPAQMTTQKEITPQTAVEILDHTAGSHHSAQQRLHRLSQHPISTTPTLPQSLLSLPSFRATRRQSQHLTHFLDQRRRHSEFLGQPPKILVELLGKSQQRPALVFQQEADGANL